MRISIDSNILVYSVQSLADKTAAAEQLLFRAIGADCVLTNQAIGEFLNVIRRKHSQRVGDARDVVAGWSLIFSIAPTATQQLVEASALAERHRLQFWDAVILVVAGAAGAEWLLSEDMQDGATINGVRLLDPFNPENSEILAGLLTPASGTA